MTQDQVRVHVLSAVENELIRAMNIHGTFVDFHHGWGVISEEMHELFLEICRKDDMQNPRRIFAEAVQVAAMAAKVAMLATEKDRKNMGVGA